MASWYIKAAVQGMLSLLPRPHQWNYLFQRHISRGLRLRDTYFEQKLATCAQHLAYYDRYVGGVPKHAAELGTGWQPIVPVGLYLCGVEEIYSIDIVALQRYHLVIETLARFYRYAQEGRLTTFLPAAQPERVQRLTKLLEGPTPKDVESLLRALHIEYRVEDARRSNLRGINLILSNSTFEHISQNNLRAILQAFSQMLESNGLMSHLIDMSDHYSHFDRKLSPYHFLQHQGLKWRLVNNSLQYQNRLRVSDYRQLHQEAGFVIVEEANATPPQANMLRTITLAPAFTHYTEADLLPVVSRIRSISSLPDKFISGRSASPFQGLPYCLQRSFCLAAAWNRSRHAVLPSSTAPIRRLCFRSASLMLVRLMSFVTT
jgi:hypothetical protein